MKPKHHVVQNYAHRQDYHNALQTADQQTSQQVHQQVVHTHPNDPHWKNTRHTHLTHISNHS